jgi:lipopolysaccharide transport system ATP-binding protein
MTEVEQFCERAVLLNGGHIEFQGSGSEAVKRYYLIEQMDRLSAIAPEKPVIEEQQSSIEPLPPASQEDFQWPGAGAFLDISGKTQVSNGCARFTALAVCNQDCQPTLNFEQGEMASFFIEIEVLRDLEVPVSGIELINQQGIIVYGKNTLQFDVEPPVHVHKGARLRYRHDIKLELMVGEYTFNLGFSTLSETDFRHRAMFAHADLDSKVAVIDIMVNAGYFGVAFRRHGQPVQLLHHGIANLPGGCAIGMVHGT